MISLFKQDKIGTFEYFYFFVMIIYMAQLDGNTNRMIVSLSSPLLPFLLPIILTIILLDRNKVKFDDKRLIRISLTFIIWTILLFAHKSSYDSSQYSYYFFLLYSIVIAYIHVQVFGEKLLPLYESIMVKLCFIDLVLWGLCIIYPGFTSIFRSFPETSCGNNFFYIFNCLNPSIHNDIYISNGIVRNAGFSWEPGRFAIMVVLALFCNLARCGIKFRGNGSGIILLLTLASTQSTTGYIAAIVLYSFFSIKKFNFRYILAFLIFVVPIGYQLSKLDFMREKIESQLDLDTELRKSDEVIDYVNKTHKSNEYVSSLGRFQAMYYELINIQMDPILGYGRNPGRSYFAQRISGNFSLPGGLLKMFGEHGIPLGILLYVILYKSSVALGRAFRIRKGTFFVLYLIFLVSYGFFTAPIFTAFWFYGLFRKEDDLLIPVTEDSSENAEELTNETTSLEIKE